MEDISTCAGVMQKHTITDNSQSFSVSGRDSLFLAVENPGKPPGRFREISFRSCIRCRVAGPPHEVSQLLTPRGTCKNVAISLDRQSVKSVILRSAGYDGAKKVLEIEFTSGLVYRYSGVPEKVWTDLMHSTEAGKYFSEKIRPKFQARAVVK